jgi:hypothetical protein
MIRENKLTIETIQKEIELGYFRPSLIKDIMWRHRVPRFLHGFWDRKNAIADKLSGYVPHKAIYEAKKARLKAIAVFEAGLQQQ